MKYLKIKFTSKLESEYFGSRLERVHLSKEVIDINDTDTIIKVSCLDIRLDTFESGLFYFSFLRHYIEPATVVASAKYVEEFNIWNI